MQRFRGGLVFKVHRLLYHSTLDLRVIKKKKRDLDDAGVLVRRERAALPVLMNHLLHHLLKHS